MTNSDNGRHDEHDPLTKAEIERRQKSRNLMMGGALLFFVGLFYFITIVRMG
jgi:hypothetical protein